MLEKIERVSRSGVEFISLANSGTKVNTMTIAVASTGRNRVMVIHNSYHGGTDPSQELCWSQNINLSLVFCSRHSSTYEAQRPFMQNDRKTYQPWYLQTQSNEVADGSWVIRTLVKYLTAQKLETVFPGDEVMTTRLTYSTCRQHQYAT